MVPWAQRLVHGVDQHDGRNVPGFHIIAGQYTGLLVVSLFILWLVTQ